MELVELTTSMASAMGESFGNVKFPFCRRQQQFIRPSNVTAKMNVAESSAVLASLKWVKAGAFTAPWLKYNPSIYVRSIPELNMSQATWDIVVREIRSITEEELTSSVVFQFASRRAPHDLLKIGLEFDLNEGPGNCVWKGVVDEVWLAPRDPNYWYSKD